MNTPARHHSPGVWALLRRHAQTLRAAWQVRHALAGARRQSDEIAFLPAALSLQDTPVHPAPRCLAWGLVVLFLSAVVWSVFGEVDIVALAPGRIVVSERTKQIQPLETSVVRRVLVKDGQRVQAGQVLIELDPTMASADRAAVEELRHTALSEELRTTALLRALAGGSPNLPANAPADPAIRRQLDAEWQDISARMARLDAELARRRAEITTVQAAIAKLEATLPLAQAREADFQTLVAQGFVSSHATQDKLRERVELERDLATQRARLLESQAALTESLRSLNAYRAETVRGLNDRRAQAASRHAQLAQDQAKAAQRERQTQLLAPVAGVIQQLAVHAAGSVVTAAQPLMVVVPEAAEVTAEVLIANQDIGFVHPGQSAEIKLDTFSYVKYGTVPAAVSLLTADAVVDEKRGGAHYPAILTLHRRTLDIDGKPMALAPGMSLTAEIRTGRRRLIEYLLSPLQQWRSESFKER
ncbi:MAG: HlyD family type I secretion periplasmic adaptor subunit [Burkholderiaceae bacterium]|uniref:HlyD family type I secretion periplasmic adaptor subunit n=1 Tax=Hydrogenophaga sp. TaxID=1904254 RepID=UPI002722FE85|nr:HlyD family type I secretion periplasmic adaptor subunit [Hydrogenophaga sp.]MDO8277867.1 HlyD family type I secretion periplasmic adaptor subunit [Burkholderiaceae bacterium]MDO9030935.1 HlyD family type I secretion periplasmic adaptor subunit [Hydrogenophaga sp.]